MLGLYGFKRTAANDIRLDGMEGGLNILYQPNLRWFLFVCITTIILRTFIEYIMHWYNA